jgi:hypothetical protein
MAATNREQTDTRGIEVFRYDGNGGYSYAGPLMAPFPGHWYLKSEIGSVLAGPFDSYDDAQMWAEGMDAEEQAKTIADHIDAVVEAARRCGEWEERDRQSPPMHVRLELQVARRKLEMAIDELS